MTQARLRRFTLILHTYPIALILVALGLNMFVFGVTPAIIAAPDPAVVQALVAAGVLLALNHTWLMTATELVRLNYNMHASPEEWAAADQRRQDVAPEGWIALERHHNAHRNATENIAPFVVLVLPMVLVSPARWAAVVWIAGFGVARLGYTYAALRGKTGLRGACMSFALLALYGLATYLALALVV